MRFRYQRVLLLVAGALCLNVAANESNASLTMPDLIGLVEARAPEVLAARAAREAALQRLAQAQGALGPSVTVNGDWSETRYDDRIAGGVRTFNAKQVAINATQPLVRPALLAALDIAEAEAQSASTAVEAVLAETRARLTDNVVATAAACMRLSAALSKKDVFGKRSSQLKRQQSLGLIGELDVLPAVEAVRGAELELDLAGRSVRLQEELLSSLVGERLRLECSNSASSPGSWVDASTLVSAAHFSCQEPGHLLSSAPRIRIAEFQLEAARKGIESAQAAQFPTIDLTLGANRVSESGSNSFSFPRSSSGGVVGVSVRVPLFASGALSAKISEAVAQQERARGELQQQRAKIESELHISCNQLVGSQLRHQSLRSKEQISTQQIQGRLRQRALGTADLSAQLDAEERRLATWEELISNWTIYWQAVSRMDAALGQRHAMSLKPPNLTAMGSEFAARAEVPPPRALVPQSLRLDFGD